MTSPNSGIALIDKPTGLTSQQCVSRVRSALGVRRAGHTGTLDPFATGLLLVLIGPATRLAPYVADEPKEYDALIRFGSETDTDDATGTPVRNAQPPGQSTVASAMATLTGAIEQIPPAFSAKHVDGQRAYRLARKGVRAELPPVNVQVEQWQVVEQGHDFVRARIVCSGGTYIRALARDLGRLTSSAAHCAELRRLRCGPFSVDDAVSPAAVQPQHVRSPLTAVAGLPVERVDDTAALGVAHGRPVDATVTGDWAALVNERAELMAIAERAGNQWRPRVVLSDPQHLAPST